MKRTNKLLVEGVGALDPDNDDTQEDNTEVGSGCGQGAESHNHELLDEGTSGLAQRVADHVNGGLTLQLQQANVAHVNTPLGGQQFTRPGMGIFTASIGRQYQHRICKLRQLA